jgi:DNA-directed RNA polymerase specialized sigma24 family protein
VCPHWGVSLATGGSPPSKLGNWFREWRLPLRRFLARQRAGCAADIDDIAQEVFLRLLRYDRSELIDYPQAYLFKIASNVSAEWAMRSSRRMPHHSECCLPEPGKSCGCTSVRDFHTRKSHTNWE